MFEFVTKSIKDVSADVTKTMTETSKENNKALQNLHNKLLEVMNDRGILACYLMSLVSKITSFEHTSQFKLIKDPSSNSANDLLVSKSIPFTLIDHLLTFRDTDEKVQIQGDLLKMITSKNYNVNLAKHSVKKLVSDFAKELYFDKKVLVNKSTRDKTVIRLLKSPAIMASRISTISFTGKFWWTLW